MSDWSNEERMDIYSPKGTKVVYAFPTSGYPMEQEFTRKHLEVGGLYTIARTDVHRSSTDVYLEGFGDKRFNSVMFAPASHRPKEGVSGHQVEAAEIDWKVIEKLAVEEMCESDETGECVCTVCKAILASREMLKARSAASPAVPTPAPTPALGELLPRPELVVLWDSDLDDNFEGYWKEDYEKLECQLLAALSQPPAQVANTDLLEKMAEALRKTKARVRDLEIILQEAKEEFDLTIFICGSTYSESEVEAVLAEYDIRQTKEQSQ